MMEASHFDVNEAFAAIDRHRLTDNEPYIYRTRDNGKTWQKITSGLPAGVYLQTVKEDPVRKGLLFAGTELGVFVSFDDGDNWQSLQLNLPHTSNRDLAILPRCTKASANAWPARKIRAPPAPAESARLKSAVSCATATSTTAPHCSEVPA